MTLTKSDLGKIDVRLENQKDDILEEMDEKLTNLRSDFFEKIDPILKEVLTAREERPLIIKRIEKVEKNLQI
jgi:hypothetical protein